MAAPGPFESASPCRTPPLNGRRETTPSSDSPPSKRIKTEIKQEPVPEPKPKFRSGDRVYKSNLTGSGKTTLFNITMVYPYADSFTYILENEHFLGEGSTIRTRESQIYTVEHQVNTVFEFPVEGTAGATFAKGTIKDWNFVDGQVVYDLAFDKELVRRDLPESILNVGSLGEVKARSSSILCEKNSKSSGRPPTVVVTKFDVGTIQTTADKLGRPQRSA
jgi:hypothetical protein